MGDILSVTDALSHTISYTYDALNRQIGQTDALGHISNAVGNIISTTDTLSHTTSYNYDIATTDALGRSTKYTYDADNRLIKTIDPLQQQGAIAYDGVGNITSITDELGRVTGYAYDAGDGNLTRYVGNNSVNAIDPSGLELVLPHFGLPSLGSIGSGVFKLFKRGVPGLGTVSDILTPPGNIVSEQDERRQLNRYKNLSKQRQPKPELVDPPNPNFCPAPKKKTCASPEYSGYSHIREATDPHLYFGGFRDENLTTAITFIKSQRGKYLKFKVSNSNPTRYKSDPTSQLNLIQGNSSPIDRPLFRNPDR